MAPASSSSHFPQPSRERWATPWAGLLAHGTRDTGSAHRDSYSPLLPSFENDMLRGDRGIMSAASGLRGFRSHSQRRDREGLAPSSLLPRRIVDETLTLENGRKPCQVQICPGNRSGVRFLCSGSAGRSVLTGENCPSFFDFLLQVNGTRQTGRRGHGIAFARSGEQDRPRS